MKCTVCGHEIITNGNAPAVCPQCGAVNTVQPEAGPGKLGAFTVAAVHNDSKGFRAWLGRRKKPVLIAATVFAAALIVTASAFATVLRHSSLPSDAATQTDHIAVSRPPVSTSPTPTATPTPTAAPKAASGSVGPTTTQLPVGGSGLDHIINDINNQLAPYEVTASLSPANNNYTYSTWSSLDSLDIANLQTFDTYLTQEFKKYPTDLVKNSGLKTIGLVRDLHVSGQGRAAVPVPDFTEMVYDVDLMATSGSQYAREVISHEYWHYLDYKTHGDYYYTDAKWSACNPSGFTYGAGGSTAYDPSSGYVAAFHPSPDFVTAYSKYGIEEDRAEMFGWLIYDPAKVKGLNDPGINCKINRLTTLVHQLSPGMTF